MGRSKITWQLSLISLVNFQAEVPTRFGSLDDVTKVCGTWQKNHPNYVEQNLPLGKEELNPLKPEDIPTVCWPQLKWFAKFLTKQLELWLPNKLGWLYCHLRCPWPICLWFSLLEVFSCFLLIFFRSGSCWAFGSTEAFEDRRCIATKVDQEFSVMDTAGCCKVCSVLPKFLFLHFRLRDSSVVWAWVAMVVSHLPLLNGCLKSEL